MTFKDLHINQIFEFDHVGIDCSSNLRGCKHGPWIKLDDRSFRPYDESEWKRWKHKPSRVASDAPVYLLTQEQAVDAKWYCGNVLLKEDVKQVDDR